MTKQEQIEEIKQVLIKTCKRCRSSAEDYMQSNYAEALYNAGYQKIDKDSVVLKIKELEDTCNKCHWVTDYKILKYHEEEVIKLCEQDLKQARKETAKEIYDLCCGHGTTFIKKYLKEKYGVEGGGIMTEQEQIDEVVKEMYCWKCIESKRATKEDIRKETAIDILLELDLFLKGTTLRQGYEFKKINEKLKEIAEKYGVEVEE